MATEPMGRRGLLLLAVLFEGGLAVLALGAGWVLDRPVADAVRWDGRDTLLGVAASLPMLLGFWLCLRSTAGPLARIRQVADELLRPLFATCTVADLAL